MKNSKLRCAGVLVALSATVLSGCGLKPSSPEPPEANPGTIQPLEGAKDQTITMGAKNYTEQLILGKMGVLVAKAAGFDVIDMTNIPGSQPARRAIKDGDVDIEWDYTGVAWMNYMGHEEGISDQDEMWQAVYDADQENGLTWGKPSPMNNTYAFGVRKDYAEKYNLTKFSDMKKVPSEERSLCVESEFNSRTDGLNGMLKSYGMKRDSAEGIPEGKIYIMDTGTIYTGVAESACNFGEITTTDGRVKSLDLAVLDDDHQFFPAYNVAPVFKTETLEKYPELAERFDQVAQRLDNETMMSLNYKVDVDGEEPAKVAYDWMVQEGFITEAR